MSLIPDLHAEPVTRLGQFGELAEGGFEVLDDLGGDDSWGREPRGDRRRRVLSPRRGVPAVVVAVGVVAAGCAGSPGGDGGGGPAALDPVLSYAPTCTSAAEPGCLSGTEVQALETFGGRLYAGTTNWEETLAAVWPTTSAQVNVLASRDGTWERTPDLPGSPACSPGTAPWEQVNDLHAATFASAGGTTEHLFATVLANEDGACPGLQATVFSLDASGRSWVDTGLDARLERLYGAVSSEVRYVETFSDGTSECPAERPCVFAFVGPRAGTVGPSVWRGVYDPDDARCEQLCWDAGPEVIMDGVHAPAAARIVSSASGATGLFFGTTALGAGRCRAANLPQCDQAALMRRVGPKRWEPVWLGSAVSDGGPDQVRGIASWQYENGAQSLWFVTTPVGAVYRMDGDAGTLAAPIEEASLGELHPEECTARMLPYQIHVHDSGSDDASPQLLVASEGCGGMPSDRFARIFQRPVARDGGWTVSDMPEITSVGDDRSNEAAVRWIETSPFDSGDIYFGTTDMNSTPGSLTARIYRVALP